MKTCRKCGETKPAEAFNRCAENKDGLQRYCRACAAVVYKIWFDKNSERKRAVGRKYFCRGWAPGEHEKAEEARPHVTECAVCGTMEPGKIGWHADHCHKTGLFRGHLCGCCNRALGFCKDDPLILRKALDYLLKHS